MTGGETAVVLLLLCCCSCVAVLVLLFLCCCSCVAVLVLLFLVLLPKGLDVFGSDGVQDRVTGLVEIELS